MFHNNRDKLNVLVPQGQKIDFIFDKAGESKAILEVWGDYIKNRPDEIRQYYGATPRFEDDEEFKPLQAADFWAWWVRRWYLARTPEKIETEDFGAWKASKVPKGIATVFFARDAIDSEAWLIALICCVFIIGYRAANVEVECGERSDHSPVNFFRRVVALGEKNKLKPVGFINIDLTINWIFRATPMRFCPRGGNFCRTRTKVQQFMKFSIGKFYAAIMGGGSRLCALNDPRHIFTRAKDSCRHGRRDRNQGIKVEFLAVVQTTLFEERDIFLRSCNCNDGVANSHDDFFLERTANIGSTHRPKPKLRTFKSYF